MWKLYSGVVFKKKGSVDEFNSLMADRGFTVENLLKPLGVSLNIPAFLHGREQLTNEEVTQSQTIPSVQIHLERAIQRIKKFRQIRNDIPLVLHGSINQIWTVSCLLCNFNSALIIMQNKYKLYIIVKNFQNIAKNILVPSTKIKYHIQYTLKHKNFAVFHE